MSTNRKRMSRSRSHLAEVSNFELEYLLTGWNMFDDTFKSDEEARQSWEQNRDFVLSLQEKTGDGSFVTKGTGDKYFDHFERPWGWWKFDSPTPRKYVMKRHKSDASHDYFFPQYETERAYLTRHQLLNNAEKALTKGE